MPETMPDGAPRSIVRAHQQPEGIFCAETADEVRAKMREFDQTTDEDGLIGLMCIDVISHRDAPPEFFPYEHSLRPLLVLDVREITVGWWKATQEQHTTPEQPPMPPGFKIIGGESLMEALGGMPGFTPPQAPPDSSDTTHEGIPAIREEAQDSDECCCGHAVSAHGDAQKFVGACMVQDCPCNLYHTHPEESGGE